MTAAEQEKHFTNFTNESALTYFNMENNMTCMIYQPQLRVLNDKTTRQWYFKIQ